MAKRLKAMGTPGYENGFRLTLLPNRLEEPQKRKSPTVYFVNSMSDLFHQSVSDAFVNEVFDSIRACPQHTFQILTKRAERLATYCSRHEIPQNAWLGVSVEDRRHGVPRIEHLRSVTGCIRFLSVEPLLEDLGTLDLSNIDWVIVGGESGPKARPMNEQWVRRVKVQCEDQGVKFFFKQWGAWGTDGVRRSKKANGRLLDGQTWDDMPERLCSA
ncbi:protein gp37 [Paraburkholderia caledonica]|uniref:Protein gp37 n=2 Tax=Paraburkholderia caledonica TaxID=134536 RepID=A0AB73IMZ0_9BURK|nr:protein gp37 [Paraburkholderia caledonica]